MFCNKTYTYVRQQNALYNGENIQGKRGFFSFFPLCNYYLNIQPSARMSSCVNNSERHVEKRVNNKYRDSVHQTRP